MRYGPWVVNQHPLGPSTDTAQENCFQNPYDATVGAAISRPYGNISTNNNLSHCLPAHMGSISLSANRKRAQKYRGKAASVYGCAPRRSIFTKGYFKTAHKHWGHTPIRFSRPIQLAVNDLPNSHYEISFLARSAGGTTHSILQPVRNVNCKIPCRDKLLFVDFQTRCIATVGAANSRPKTFKFLSVSDKRQHFR